MVVCCCVWICCVWFSWVLLLDLVVVRCLVCVLGFTCAFVLGLLRWLVCLLLVLFCLSWFALPKL